MPPLVMSRTVMSATAQRLADRAHIRLDLVHVRVQGSLRHRKRWGGSLQRLGGRLPAFSSSASPQPPSWLARQRAQSRPCQRRQRHTPFRPWPSPVGFERWHPPPRRQASCPSLQTPHKMESCCHEWAHMRSPGEPLQRIPRRHCTGGPRALGAIQAAVKG